MNAIEIKVAGARCSRHFDFLPSPFVGAGFKPALRSDNATAGRFETCPYEISPYPRCTPTGGESKQNRLSMTKAFMQLPWG
jgi:hypothetical protein